MKSYNPNREAKTVIHVRCHKCKLEQLGHHGSACWKCPGGIMKFIGGDAIKERVAIQQKSLTSTNQP